MVPVLATHRALLLGVGDYAPQTGWADLASANDTAAIQGVLGRWGFEAAHVRVVLDATRDQLLAALGRLRDEAARGDHLLVTWSGHGQQLADDDGDEADGWDEAVVPVDAPMRPEATYDGARHLRDDDLGEALEALRQAVGPTGSVAVWIDACHSGTATRGSLPVRGGAPPIGRGGPPAASSSGSDFVASGSGGGAPLVVLSAARADQLARETPGPDGRPLGALTAALVQALGDDRPLTAWSAVYDVVRAEMARTVAGQVPQLEGDRHRAPFGGTQLAPDPYFTVAGVLSDRRIRLDAGTLQGLTVGTTVALGPAGALRADGAPLARGTVTAATATGALVELDPATDEGQLRAARAFVTAWALGDLALPVRLGPGVPARWTEAVGAGTLLRVDAAAPELVVAGLDGDVVLTDPVGRELARSPADAAPAGSAVLAALTARAHARLVRLVALDGAAHAVEARLREGCPPGPVVAPDAAGLHVGVGRSVSLELEHVGTTDSYVSVVIVDVDGRASQLAPGAGEPPAVLPPGRSWVVPWCLTAEPPLGTVELKVFATRSPVDLGPVLGWAGGGTRGGSSDALQRLLDDAAEGTRGLVTTSVAADGWTASLVVDVVAE